MSSIWLWKTKLPKIARFLLIFVLAASWLFSGFPSIWQNPRIPPKIREARAAD